MSAVLLDNDIVLKISRYSLVNEFLDVCCIPNATYILPTLKYVFRLDDENQAIRRVGDRVMLQSMKQLVDRVDELSEQPTVEMLANFQDVSQIDAGESVLFAVAAMWDHSMTITGDKRALIALASLCQKTGLSDTLSGRLKCLEQTVAEIMFKGFGDEVIRKIHGKNWDTALRICFSTQDFNNAIEGLSSYYRNLNEECFGMLAPFPTTKLT